MEVTSDAEELTDIIQRRETGRSATVGYTPAAKR
jgi:hypothetical protein